MHHLNHYEKLNHTKDGTIRFLQENWFSEPNIEQFIILRDKLTERIGNQEENQTVIFNTPANLTFFEALVRYLIDHPENIENRPSNAEMEMLLIKAYLIINKRITNDNTGLTETNENFPKEEPFWLFLHSYRLHFGGFLQLFADVGISEKVAALIFRLDFSSIAFPAHFIN